MQKFLLYKNGRNFNNNINIIKDFTNYYESETNIYDEKLSIIKIILILLG